HAVLRHDLQAADARARGNLALLIRCSSSTADRRSSRAPPRAAGERGDRHVHWESCSSAHRSVARADGACVASAVLKEAAVVILTTAAVLSSHAPSARAHARWSAKPAPPAGPCPRE